MTLMLLWLNSSKSLQADVYVTVTNRMARQYVDYSGGYAIQGDQGSAGSSLSQPGLFPHSLSLDGTHHADGVYNGHTWSYDVGWGLFQSWNTTDTTIQALGSIDLAAVGSDTFGIDGWNNQEMYFTVSDSTDYSLTGSISNGQSVDFQQYNFALGQWIRVYLAFGSTTNFSRTGTLGAGLFRVINSPYSFTADGSFQPSNSWDWTMTFPNAHVSAIPEPSGGVAACLIISFLVLRRRTSRSRFEPCR